VIDPLEYKPILEKLLEKTRAGRIAWEATSGDSFRCTLDAYRIYVWETDEGDYGLRAEDAQGRTLFRVRVEREIIYDDPEQEREFVMLSDLYELARRKALNVPQTLANVAELLDKI
jgi:hypothetical protein